MPDLAIVENFAHLPSIHSEADYDRMVALMNALLDVAGTTKTILSQACLNWPLMWCPATNRSITR